jgi:hypothetical protein
MPKSVRPAQVYDFTAFSRRTPTQQPPGDRIDAQFREHADCIAALLQRLDAVEARLADLLQPKADQPFKPVLGPNAGGPFASDVAGATATAADYAQVSIDWAEHMPDTIPPNTLAINAISGDHWSSRWWANRAAAIVSTIGNTAIADMNFCEDLSPQVTAPGTTTLTLAHAPVGPLTLVVNRASFLPAGVSPPFSVVGQTLTWASALYSLNPGDEVIAHYNFKSGG